MGQKTHPIGFRLGVIRGWDSNWFAGKDYAEKLVEDDEIRSYLAARLKRAGLSRVVIERTPKRVILTLHTSRPGVVIGRGGAEVEKLREELFRLLGVLRVYSKEPGKKPDLDRPYTVKEGSTVIDLARAVHKDFAENFRFARLWGSARFDGQPVERDYPLADGDIVELHI